MYSGSPTVGMPYVARCGLPNRCEAISALRSSEISKNKRRKRIILKPLLSRLVGASFCLGIISERPDVYRRPRQSLRILSEIKIAVDHLSRVEY